MLVSHDDEGLMRSALGLNSGGGSVDRGLNRLLLAIREAVRNIFRERKNRFDVERNCWLPDTQKSRESREAP